MADATPEPQWGRDPTGRHVQRYWDGSAWTDFVASASGGPPATDPLGLTVAPQWARDPTGRHVQRYWDGTGWTGFVASAAGGTPVADPLEAGAGWPAPGSPAAPAPETAPLPEPIDATPSESRRRFPPFGWVVLALAIVTGVVLALPHGSDKSADSNAASTSQGSASPAGSTSPAATPSSTKPATPVVDEAGDSKFDEAGDARIDPARGGARLIGCRGGAAQRRLGEGPGARGPDRAHARRLPGRVAGTSAAPSHGLDFSVPQCTRFHDRLAGTNAVARDQVPGLRQGGTTRVVVRRRAGRAARSERGRRHGGRSGTASVPGRRLRGRGPSIDRRARRCRSIRLNATVDELSVPRVGDQSAGLQVVTRTTSQGVTVARYADVVVFRVGRTAVLTVFESPETPFDGPRDALLRTLATRLRRSGARHAVAGASSRFPPNLAVPGVGLEPTRPCGQPVLSRSRMPIPPSGPAQTLPVAMPPAAEDRSAAGGWAGRGAVRGRRLIGPWRGRCCSGASWT